MRDNLDNDHDKKSFLQKYVSAVYFTREVVEIIRSELFHKWMTGVVGLTAAVCTLQYILSFFQGKFTFLTKQLISCWTHDFLIFINLAGFMMFTVTKLSKNISPSLSKVKVWFGYADMNKVF